jgi:hypothetical protein
MKNNITKIIYWGFLSLALLGLAICIFPALRDFFIYGFKAIAYPYSIDYGEGPLLDQTMRLARFHNIYSNSLNTPPYTISNYPPLYLLLQVPFAWVFGPAFWYGRLINLLSVLLTALFIFLTLRALTRDWIASLVAGLLLVAFPYIQHWSKFNRIDELALVLSWAGLFVIVSRLGRFSPLLLDKDQSNPSLLSLAKKGFAYRPFWLASLLLVASIFTRQTYALAAPFAAFFWLIFGARGSWKNRFLQAGLLAVAVGGLTLVLFLLLVLATAGGFYLNIVVANVNAFSWGTVWHYINEITDKLWPLGGLGLLTLLAEGIQALVQVIRRRSQPRSSQPAAPQGKRTLWALLLPYLLAASAGSLTIGKDGSNVNYLLEFSAALCLSAGAAIAWTGQWRRWYVRLPIQFLLVGLLAYQSFVLSEWNRNDSVAYIKGSEAGQSAVAQVKDIIQNTPGLVLADEYMGLIPLAGKQLYFQPFEFKQMSDAKVWDQTPFLAEIAAHKFDRIVWYQPSGWPAIKARYTPEQIEAIESNYTIERQFGDIQVMVPNK